MALYGPQVLLSFKIAFPNALRNAQNRLLQFSGYDGTARSPLLDVSSGGGSQTAVMGAAKQNYHGLADTGAVIVHGEAKLIVGAAVPVHSMVTADGQGRAIVCTSGQWAIGMAMEAATTAGEVVRVLIRAPAIRQTW